MKVWGLLFNRYEDFEDDDSRALASCGALRRVTACLGQFAGAFQLPGPLFQGHVLTVRKTEKNSAALAVCFRAP